MKVCSKTKAFTAAVLLMFIVSAAVFIKMGLDSRNNSLVKIVSDGKVIYEFNLQGHNEEIIDIPSPNGGKNTVEIKDGTVFVADATCPDKLCIKQGKRGADCMNAAPIVCLPNKMYISVGGGDVDAAAGAN